MAHPEQRTATYQDIIDLPEHLVGEIIAGELHTSRGPRRAMRAHVRGGRQADGAVRRGGWRARRLVDPGRAGTAPVAAYSGAGSGGLAAGADAEVAEYGVVPAGSGLGVRGAVAGYGPQGSSEEMPIYAGSGVGHLWLLDPDQRTLEVYENTGGRWLLLGIFENEDEVAAVPFDAITFNLGGLWAN